jgi:hypothetical protein
MKKKMVWAASLGCLSLAAYCLTACQTQRPKAKPVALHLAEVHRNDHAVYVDQFDSRRLVQTAGANAFTCYKITFEDSELPDEKSKRERNLYYEFRAGNDWKALSAGDSIKPVFFQPIKGLNEQVKEVVLVFELPEGRRADTLVYNDSYGDWQQQVMPLNPNNK